MNSQGDRKICKAQYSRTHSPSDDVVMSRQEVKAHIIHLTVSKHTRSHENEGPEDPKATENQPFSNSDSSDQISGIPSLLTGKQSLFVGELIQFCFEVDVGLVDGDICIKLSSSKPSSSEIAREVAAWLHHLSTIHSCQERSEEQT